MKITRLPANIENRTKRVAGYARVSTLFEDQEESYESQCSYYQSYISSVPGWQLVDIYADHGKSGLSAAKRPDFMRMIEDCQNGLIDIILVKSISRFGRNATEVLEYVHKLRECNTEVRFERENLSSNNPSTEMVLNFLAAVAEEESRSISENVKISLKWSAERGERHIGNNRLYGYDEVDGKLIPNDDAWIPELVFTAYAKGKSYAEICLMLQEKGATRMRDKAKNKPFNSTLLSSMLHNEIYMGDRIIQKNPPINYKTKKIDKTVDYQQYYVENDHEPVVDLETWNKVQERLKKEAEERDEKGIYRKRSSHYLYGRVICGECGEPMLRRTMSYHGEMQKVWKCRDRLKGSSGNGCKNSVIGESELLQLICLQANIRYRNLESLTEAHFRKIKEVRVYDDRHLEIIMAE